MNELAKIAIQLNLQIALEKDWITVQEFYKRTKQLK